ncbi:MAG: adenylate/guanylate cyclase domain-containing protein [Deltaproteobacteria bacterium]|nr:adenylate/guanylate cyclase domain-containing protein [Deltaproteobacteria bacterium]
MQLNAAPASGTLPPPVGLATLRVMFGKFTTPEVASLILADPKEFWTKSERRTVTTLFADVRGFTSFAARVAPEEALPTLNRIFAILCEVVASEHGIVNRFLGDGMLAVFGTPFPLEDHASAAARAALRACAKMAQFADERRAQGREPLQIGLGLNTGSVIAGCIGTPERTEYTVVGHSVNVASRLVAIAEPGQILVGAGTAALVDESLAVHERGTVDLKGIGPTVVYELVDRPAQGMSRGRA